MEFTPISMKTRFLLMTPLHAREDWLDVDAHAWQHANKDAPLSISEQCDQGMPYNPALTERNNNKELQKYVQFAMNAAWLQQQKPQSTLEEICIFGCGGVQENLDTESHALAVQQATSELAATFANVQIDFDMSRFSKVHRCSKCGDTLQFALKQTRSADEGMTLMRLPCMCESRVK